MGEFGRMRLTKITNRMWYFSQNYVLLTTDHLA